MRRSVSVGVLACVVASEPPWPVFIACIRWKASPPRTSPTTMRSGRRRSAECSRSPMSTRALAELVGGAAISKATRWDWLSWSSAESSMVRMRSSSGMSDETMLSSVVLPEPVPPDTSMLSLVAMPASMSRAIGGGQRLELQQRVDGQLVLEELADGDGGAACARWAGSPRGCGCRRAGARPGAGARR